MRFASRWVFLAQIAFVVAATMAVRPMLSYRAIDLGANAAQVGLLATTYAILPVAFAFAVGRRVDRHGPFRFMIAGSLISIAGLVVAIVAPTWRFSTSARPRSASGSY